MNINDKIKSLRIETDLLQKDIAKILSISESTYSHYESGDAIIPLNRLNNLCNYYNISIDFVFENTKQKQYSNSKQEINNKTFGQRFKEFRKEYKLNQKVIANILNTSISVISGYEIGRYTISTSFIYTICKKYSLSADYLLGKIDNNPQK